MLRRRERDLEDTVLRLSIKRLSFFYCRQSFSKTGSRSFVVNGGFRFSEPANHPMLCK